jgi:hypothetical protein
MRLFQPFLFSDALVIPLSEMEADALRATLEAIVPLVERAFLVPSAC